MRRRRLFYGALRQASHAQYYLVRSLFFTLTLFTRGNELSSELQQVHTYPRARSPKLEDARLGEVLMICLYAPLASI
jgi:hypothetical protein